MTYWLKLTTILLATARIDIVLRSNNAVFLINCDCWYANVSSSDKSV